MPGNMDLIIDSHSLEAAMTRAPKVLAVEMNKAISHSVQAMARAAKRRVPKGRSHLVNSIGAIQTSPLEGLVIAGMDYARMVEAGTGPQGPARAGRGGRPSLAAMLDWVKVKQLVPDDPDMDQRDLAFVIARSIAKKGTPPQPFMQPAFDEQQAAAEQRIQNAISKALASARIF